MPREMSWSQEVQLQRGAVRTIFCHWKIVRIPETWTDIYTDWTMTRDTTDPAESEQSISHGGRAGSLCDYIIVIFLLSSSSTSHFLSQVNVVSGIGLAPNIPKYSTFDYNCNIALIIMFTIVFLSFYSMTQRFCQVFGPSARIMSSSKDIYFSDCNALQKLHLSACQATRY